MGIFAQPDGRTWRFRALLGTLLLVAGAASAAQHPSLVDPSRAKCTTCHDRVLDKKVIHPATEDCLSCHGFSKRDSVTVVELVASGTALCLACHDSQQAAADGTMAAPHAPVTDACTECHAPHASEVKALLRSEPRELCLTCHADTDVNAAHQVPVSRADCLACHAPHGSAVPHMLTGKVLHTPFAEGSCDGCHKRSRGTRVRLGGEGAELCYACHSDKEEAFATGHVHTAVRDGKCTGCHDPHMANRPKMLKAAAPDLCLSCHAEIKARLEQAHVHPPVADGCDTCHDPHNSSYPDQLTSPLGDLCGSCHDLADAALKGKHLGTDLAQVRCTDCHDPHGSPNAGLIVAGSTHPPFAEGACASCHEDGAGKLVAGGGSSLCYSCHADKEEEFAAFPVAHAALEADDCTACHSPHAAAQPKLVKAPGGKVCTACHSEHEAQQDQVGHGVIDWIGCQACHAPHGGTRPKLLVAEGNDLCNGCHLKGAVQTAAGGSVALAGHTVTGHRTSDLKLIDLDATKAKNHPIPGHPVKGLVEKPKGRQKIAEALVGSDLGCLSCHVPHAGATPQLFAYGAASSFALCTACHPK